MAWILGFHIPSLTPPQNIVSYRRNYLPATELLPYFSQKEDDVYIRAFIIQTSLHKIQTLLFLHTLAMLEKSSESEST
jgi:hypothetical protein